MFWGRVAKGPEQMARWLKRLGESFGDNQYKGRARVPLTIINQ